MFKNTTLFSLLQVTSILVGNDGMKNHMVRYQVVKFQIFICKAIVYFHEKEKQLFYGNNMNVHKYFIDNIFARIVCGNKKLKAPTQPLSMKAITWQHRCCLNAYCLTRPSKHISYDTLTF